MIDWNFSIYHLPDWKSCCNPFFSKTFLMSFKHSKRVCSKIVEMKQQLPETKELKCQLLLVFALNLLKFRFVTFFKYIFDNNSINVSFLIFIIFKTRLMKSSTKSDRLTNFNFQKKNLKNCKWSRLKFDN